jgi:hypothetical protein
MRRKRKAGDFAFSTFGISEKSRFPKISEHEKADHRSMWSGDC